MKKKSPEIDILAGIKYYSTSFKGIGGAIKKNNDDFYVKEIINQNFLNDLSEKKLDKYIFPVYEMEKKGLDSNHAVIVLKRKLGSNFKIVGIKDAKATTVQYTSSDNNYKKIIKYIKIGQIDLHFLGFSKKPIEKSLLIGNRFIIKINNPKDKSRNNLSNFISEINDIGNFYGLQRFGSGRLVTHLVGKAILKKEFDKAIDILLTYTTKFDSKFSIEIREKLKDIKNNPSIIKTIPKGMDIEKKIAEEVIKGKESISVLRSIPINIRRLFVQAYQSFIFNNALSTSIENEYSLTKCEKNDLCFEVIDRIVFGKIKKFENFDNSAAAVASSVAASLAPAYSSSSSSSSSSRCERIPIIRLPGYAFQPSKNRFDTIIKDILNNENTTAKDFFIKEMQELSEAGGFRQAAFVSKNFKYTIDENSTLIEFTAPKGSYATTLLREIIKPDDPISAGF
ncbi:MAG TPA: tRNA pseudouridine(13) synthase TruD [Candidatus Nitrosocosmicus sp.]|nr:tRNA pseudouridine(13) synthase TruD [Candidatus Nitrosocosmicus sp.]